VPFSPITEHFEVVIDIARASAAVLVGEERLGAQESVREIWMDEYIFSKWDYISLVVQCFPLSPADEIDFKTTSDAAKGEGCTELPDGSWIYI
jgi:hypothetical protein